MNKHTTNIRLALDWTPNVNHIGFFIAKDLGFYKDLGIDLQILNPLEDNYELTPGKKLELNVADFAIAPFETVISLNNKENKVNAVAVYAILQEDLSSIVTLASSGISSPKQLHYKTYASYKARYEDHIVKQMILNDGGSGDFNISYPNKLGIWNTLLTGEANATWIFNNWEGVEADSKNIALNKFKMSDFGIPYGYSPVIIAKKENILRHKQTYINFISATKRGFLYANTEPSEAVSILKNYLTANDLMNINLEKALDQTAPYFGTPNNAGLMETERVSSFVNWLVNNDLEDKIILQQTLASNELLMPTNSF